MGENRRSTLWQTLTLVGLQLFLVWDRNSCDPGLTLYGQMPQKSWGGGGKISLYWLPPFSLLILSFLILDSQILQLHSRLCSRATSYDRPFLDSSPPQIIRVSFLQITQYLLCINFVFTYLNMNPYLLHPHSQQSMVGFLLLCLLIFIYLFFCFILFFSSYQCNQVVVLR